MSAFHSQEGKDKESMVEDYQKDMEQIFSYSYSCCVFKHGICGDRPRIPDGMPDFADLLPPEFFENMGCPPTLLTDEAKVAKVHPVETMKGPMEGAVAEEQG